MHIHSYFSNKNARWAIYAKDEKRLSYPFIGSLYDVLGMPLPGVM